jgi:hypothetical protein
MTSFRTPTRFSFFLNIKIYFCSHIAEFANIAEIFWQKTFGDIGPPCIRYKLLLNLKKFINNFYQHGFFCLKFCNYRTIEGEVI